MTRNERRPGRGTEAAESLAATASVPDAADNARARCCACRHPLTAARSLARGFGPACWRRAERAQLDARRDAVGRRLAAVGRRIAQADAHGLAVVSAALEDALDALDAEGVTP